MLESQDFKLLSSIVYRRSGIVLNEDKTYLIESRLMPVAHSHGMNGLEELVKTIRDSGAEPLLKEVTEAMTTNETQFFRDLKPFENFEKHMLPRLLESRVGKKSLRIWSAASSTGQEAYSLAMILKESSALLRNWRIDIVGTDLSEQALQKAKAGVYSQFEVQRGLPVQKLVKYFKQENNMWQLDSEIRAMVNFRPLNLLKDFSALGQFDIIYCRNVLIYFDPETKADVLNRMRKQIASDGFLCLGGAETLIGVTDKFSLFESIRGVFAPA